MPPRDLAVFHAHGGRVAAARAAFGGDDWIDLSTGIAPWSFPIDGVPLGWERLPEPDAITALEAAAAEAFGVADSAQVVAVPGTDLAMRLLARVVDAKRPSVVQPGYAGHLAAWPGATVASLPDRFLVQTGIQSNDRSACSSGPLPLQENGADLLVLASPANPDGRVTDPDVIRSLAQRMTVVFDEAYADPAPGLSPDAHDRLIVLRSFGKFYGLPGVRLGFVICAPDLANRLRELLGDWPVSSAAIAIGTAAYLDKSWSRAQQARMVETGALLDAVLHDAGFDIVGSAPLFRLIACADATNLFETLARHAILTRPFADQPDRLRIGLPRGTAGLVRLATALEEFIR